MDTLAELVALIRVTFTVIHLKTDTVAQGTVWLKVNTGAR